jgi:NhaP-type Na+/H+ or K+/H+ antiporter
VALLGYWAGLPLGAALLLGAVLAPTDPVLASDVQAESPDKEEHNIRFTLTSEAGLNDGLAFPFTYLAIAVAAAGGMSGQLLADWALWELLGKCVIGAAIGIGVGWMLGKVLYRFPKGATLAGTGLGSLALVVFLVAYGLTEVVGGYGFIAAFLAAMVLRREDYDHEYNVDLADFADYIEHAAIAVLLVLIGGSMVSAWQDLTWSMMGACLALILVVRPVVGWVSLIGSRYNKAHRAVIAIYGVRGIGTLYYLAYAFGKHHFEQAPEIWAAGLFALAVSAVLHGLTAMPVMQRIAGDDTTSLKPEEDSA